MGQHLPDGGHGHRLHPTQRALVGGEEVGLPCLLLQS